MSIKKTFVQFADSDSIVSQTDILFTNEEDAVDRALQTRALYFQTYEGEYLKVFEDYFVANHPENYSARRYVGVDKIYTRDEAIRSIAEQECTAIQQTGGFLGAERIADIFNKAAAPFAQDAPDTGYIAMARAGTFSRVVKGEKVFDRSGKQIY